ncbi:hypothetical protein Deipr_2647 (plasmid) [Deinococcus proteolyticus MRP]|uniref:Uncharacterized protein n=1 Tax=Deinococcus proteolyticus (strain ATCC 35074 / DSM 20540 / JCM 6276 / NBRC 101906 / NCIMB 13154 / VKM Ac-1939 / CCM 2703 / MRP) TaxID=693977 RepID=F0RR49_DEIPM|nr:hypothetical protein [Deinococcus proteolyticus]ADY27758.1 hypothetical protein Deipr_2647 [Deinococcus proteolyticus MRP]
MTLPTHLTLLMTLRAWWQQGKSVSWLSLLAGLVLGGGTLLVRGGVNGVPDELPAAVMGLANVTAQGQLLEVNTFMVAMSPVLLSLLCALLATVITPSIVSEDVRGGILETLLTTPLGRARIFRAYLGAAILLTLLCWGLCGTALAVTWALLDGVLPLHLELSTSLLWILAALPLSMTFWSTSVMVCASLLYPASLDASAGVNGGPARLLALGPAILLLPAVVTASQFLWPLLAGSLLLSGLAATLVLWITAKRFKTTAVLE